jgi:ABC-2 type transport system permease protein
MDSTLAMARTMLKIFLRDRQAIFFTLFFPITFMAIFGLASAGGDDPIELGVVDHAANPLSERFIAALRAKPLFNVTVGTENALRQAVVDGDAAVALVLPEGLGDDGDAPLTLLVDAAEARETAMLTPLIFIGSTILLSLGC